MADNMEKFGDVMPKIVDPMKFNVVEAHELRLMNTEWSKVVPTLEDGGYRGDEPWLLYHGRGASRAHLYDPLRDRRYGCDDSNFQGARVLGSNLGWVVAVASVSVNPRSEHNLFLYNPFSTMRYDLPVLNAVFPLPSCVVRYGVITSDPLQNGAFVCVVTDCSAIVGSMARPLHLHYLLKTNGVWETAWKMASVPLVDDDDAPDFYDYKFVQHISPSENTVCIRLRDNRSYEFNLVNPRWKVSQTPVPDGVDLNRFDDLTIGELKVRLDLPANIGTRVEIIGTKTDRVRVKNKFASDDASTSEVDGVWLEVRR
ncbi:unnamed protein product [Arabidopsis arenosa]|uniref:KIB1-4 beta-propeller domain-containing protein n=1 Tax=Arabidopsis arenosa TaxID=38785 RepID=A0A8S1ZN94_ARAAE|nr:unnamed protein product [Arabidopsis arenosa]CAE5962663.1 unnamed protein product [Arabidopsis arenosa]